MADETPWSRVSRWVRESVERHPVRAAALFGVGSIAIFLCCFTPIFYTNDDAAMMCTASGRFYGRPSEHLIFTNVLIGLALKLLYTSLPRVHWYALYLYALHAAGLALLFYAFIGPRPTRRGLLLLLVPLWYFEPTLLMSVQFTSSAMVLGTGAVMAFLARAAETRHRVRLAIAAGVLLGIAGLVRLGALGATLAFALPLIVLGARRAGVRLTALWLAAALAFAGGAYGIERAYYRADHEWTEFFEFNNVRGVLHNVGRFGQVSASTLDEIEWTRNDLNMFADWFFFEPETYSTEALRTLSSRDRDRRIDLLRPTALKQRAKEAAADYGQWLTMALVCLGFSLPLLSRRGALLALSASAMALATFGALLSFGRLPLHVVIPGMFSWTLALAFALLRDPAPATSARSPYATLAAGVAALLLFGTPHFPSIGELRDASREHRRQNDVLIQQYQHLRELDADGVFFVRGSTIPIEAELPFGPPLPRVRELELGWPQRSPVFIHYLRSLGITDPYWALAHRPHTYLVTYPASAELFTRFMREHRDEEVPMLRITSLPHTGAAIYQAEMEP